MAFILFGIFTVLTISFFIFVLSDDFESFKDKCPKLIKFLLIILVLCMIFTAIYLGGIGATRSNEVIESNCIISNNTIDSMLNFNSVGYADIVICGFRYIVTENAASWYIIHCGDKIETVYFGGWLHDSDTIRYTNEYYIIYNPNDGSKTVIY